MCGKNFVALENKLIFPIMKNVLTIALLLAISFSVQAQNKGEALDFERIESFDLANKIYIDLKAKTPDQVVVLEKNYIVSSDRVKQINKRFTEEENNSGRIVTVTHNGMKDFSEQWTALIKVLINDVNVLKLREYEEENFQMLVEQNFDGKILERIAEKAKWPITLSE